MSTDQEESQTPKSEQFNFSQAMYNLIQQVEELRLDFNRLGSPEDDRLLDLIVARVVSNNEFAKSVAREMFALAAAQAAARNQPQEPEQASPKAFESHGIRLPSGVSLREGPTISTSIAEFEGVEGYIEIELDETGEALSGGTFFPNGGEPHPYNPDDSKEREILNAANRTYHVSITQEPQIALASGDKIWYRIDRWVDPPERPEEGHEPNG